MANIKFSQFTSTSSSSGVDFLVGYDGITNVRISPDQLIGSYLLNTSPVKIGASLELGQNAGTPSFSSSFTGTQDLFFGSDPALQKYFKNIAIGLGGQLIVNSLPGGGTVLKLQTVVGTPNLGQLQLGKYGVGTFPASGSTLIAAFDGNGNLVERDDVVTTASTLAGQIPYFTSPTEISGTQEFTVFPSSSSSGGPLLGLGLNGAAPTKGAVEVNTFLDYNSGAAFDYFLYTGAGGPFQNFAGDDAFPISVWGVGRFMGSGIHIYSDERIKKDISVSDSKEDLETISKIEISNYKYIDPAKGTGDNKKVIAQQVQKHYPLAVNEGKEIIPNVFTQSTIADGVINLSVDCKVGDKLKLIYPGNKEEIVKVIQVNKDSVKVDSTKVGDVIVYGKEVDDYKTVDYDALAMLNISATQELHKIIKKLSEEVEQLKSLKNK